MPALEALQDRLAKANAQPLGLSIDSHHVHANWARSLGGVSFPLLADFHPKGAVAKAFGIYLEDAGISDRATIMFDADGTVHYAESVGPGGERDIGALVAEAEKMSGDYKGSLQPFPQGAGVSGSPTLYVKDNCGFSQRTLCARDNLHLGDSVTLKNVSQDSAAMDELKNASGKEQAPCLVIDGKAIHEADAIVSEFAKRATGW